MLVTTTKQTWLNRQSACIIQLCCKFKIRWLSQINLSMLIFHSVKTLPQSTKNAICTNNIDSLIFKLKWSNRESFRIFEPMIKLLWYFYFVIISRFEFILNFGIRWMKLNSLPGANIVKNTSRLMSFLNFLQWEYYLIATGNLDFYQVGNVKHTLHNYRSNVVMYIDSF